MKEQDLKEEEKQVLAEFFANQVKLSEKGQSLLDVVSFIYHYNINRVRDIFAEEFTDQEVEELQEHALSLQRQYDSNEKAWINFIFDLNNTQLNTLAKAAMHS